MTLVENPSMSLQGAAKTPWRKTKQKTTQVETLMTTSPLDMPHDYSCNAAKCATPRVAALTLVPRRVL